MSQNRSAMENQGTLHTADSQAAPPSSMGRPRSVESEQAILAAAWRLLQQGNVRKVSIEAIAREAGVGKTTIYRWWPSRAAVIVDAFLAQTKTVLPFPETATAAEALTRQMAQLVQFFQGDGGRIVAQIIAEGQCDPGALESFRDRFLTPRREAARQVICRGMAAGEFDPALDLDLAMDMLYGPIYYRLLVQHRPLDQAFAAALSEQAIACLRSPVND
ncbi:MAG: TetR/AcrR family transcriptional regulator [Cyanobacteria bacterium P01_H01_bin.153]